VPHSRRTGGHSPVSLRTLSFCGQGINSTSSSVVGPTVQSFALCSGPHRRLASRSRPYSTIGRTAALGDVLHAPPGPILSIGQCQRHTPVITTEQAYRRPIVALTLSGQGRRGFDQGPRRPRTLGLQPDRHSWVPHRPLAQRANKARRGAAIQAKIANTRKDFLHKETTKIADAFGLICVGNVSGRWLQDQRHVGRRCQLGPARGMSRNLLRYKAMARAATFVDVSEYLTTQICPDCRAVGGPKATAGRAMRAWACGGCGRVHDRDVAAPRNILRPGRPALAEGSSTSAPER